MIDEPDDAADLGGDPTRPDPTDKTVQHRAIAATVKSAERRAEALAYRRQGYTYDEIGEAMDCSKQNAHKLVHRALSEMLWENVDQVRTLELARLDAMLAGLWPGAIAGDGHAVDGVLKLMDRRARYLGIDAPVKITRTDAEGRPVPDELRVIRVEIVGDPEVERLRYLEAIATAHRAAEDLQ